MVGTNISPQGSTNTLNPNTNTPKMSRTQSMKQSVKTLGRKLSMRSTKENAKPKSSDTFQEADKAAKEKNIFSKNKEQISYNIEDNKVDMKNNTISRSKRRSQIVHMKTATDQFPTEDELKDIFSLKIIKSEKNSKEELPDKSEPNQKAISKELTEAETAKPETKKEKPQSSDPFQEASKPSHRSRSNTMFSKPKSSTLSRDAKLGSEELSPQPRQRSDTLSKINPFKEKRAKVTTKPLGRNDTTISVSTEKKIEGVYYPSRKRSDTLNKISNPFRKN